jgi:hypothetical protein
MSNRQKIAYTLLPNGRYRALAVGTDAGYGIEYRARGNSKAEARRSLIKALTK